MQNLPNVHPALHMFILKMMMGPAQDDDSSSDDEPVWTQDVLDEMGSEADDFDY